MEYDDIVVGAGSSGAVIAARLSEDPKRRVLLLEAGPDYPSRERMPADLLAPHAPVIEGHNWKISAHIRDQGLLDTLLEAGRVFSASSNTSRLSMTKTAIQATLRGDSVLTRFDYPLGRVVGGSSAVNGGLALRGTPDDYEEWAKQGNPLWSWPHVLERFRALESDLDMKGPYYGNGGPLPISRARQAVLHRVQRGFLEICRDLGYPMGDHNNPNATGLGSVPRNVKDNVRYSTALAYLEPARHRPNLTLLPHTLVDRVSFEGERAVGVEASVEGRTQRISGKRVILSAGAIHTPAILMRSGIGPADPLRELGITPVRDLPGVGKNLVDHPAVGMWMIPAPGVCHLGEDIHQIMLRYTSDGGEPNDMQLYMLNSVDTAQFPELRAALGTPVAMSLSTVVGKPRSRGRLELASRDPSKPPNVYLNYATDPMDMKRLMEGVRLAWRIVHTEPLKSAMTRILAWNQKIIDSDKLLEETISTFVRGSWHPVGTARMGVSGDPGAVVDQYGSVHGCEGLTVADASIMPTIPRAPTNLTCIMIGEQIAMALRSNNNA